MTAQIAMPGIGVYVMLRATGQIGRVTAHAGPSGAPILASVNFGDTFGMFTAAELDTIDMRFQKPVPQPLTGGQAAATTGAWIVWGAAVVFLGVIIVACVGMSLQ